MTPGNCHVWQGLYWGRLHQRGSSQHGRAKINVKPYTPVFCKIYCIHQTTLPGVSCVLPLPCVVFIFLSLYRFLEVDVLSMAQIYYSNGAKGYIIVSLVSANELTFYNEKCRHFYDHFCCRISLKFRGDMIIKIDNRLCSIVFSTTHLLKGSETHQDNDYCLTRFYLRTPRHIYSYYFSITGENWNAIRGWSNISTNNHKCS